MLDGCEWWIIIIIIIIIIGRRRFIVCFQQSRLKIAREDSSQVFKKLKSNSHMKLLDEAACTAFSAFSPVTDGICIIATGLRLAKAIDDDKCDPANVPSGPVQSCNVQAGHRALGSSFSQMRRRP